LLQCAVTNLIDAAAVLPGLSGPAARIECHEELEAQGRKVGPTNPQTWSQGRVSYAHWYVLENRWSIASEGEMPIRLHGSDTIRRWTTKVISFDRNSQ
jgi:2-keto-4-pentenoate hydratase